MANQPERPAAQPESFDVTIVASLYTTYLCVPDALIGPYWVLEGSGVPLAAGSFQKRRNFSGSAGPVCGLTPAE